MQNDAQLIAQARRVDPICAKDYAKAKGWELISADKPYFLMAHHEHSLRQLKIPKDSENSDYVDALLDVAYRLSDIEKRPLVHVLEDLLEPNTDIIRHRLISSATESGNIPFEESIALMEGAKKALLSSACSVLDPQLHHSRLGKQKALQYVKSCRFGQTEFGSFILKMMCPNAMEDEQLDLTNLTKQPFGRQVTTGLLTSANLLITAIDQDQEETLLRDNKSSKILSSNFCHAILQMESSLVDAKIEIAAKWSPRLPVIGTAPSSVTIAKRHFKRIEQIYSELRNTIEQEQSSIYVGTVEELKGDIGEDGKRSGNVIVRILSDDEVINANVDLGVSEYQTAINAHTAGKETQVKIKGLLKRYARSAKIVDMSEFEIIR